MFFSSSIDSNYIVWLFSIYTKLTPIWEFSNNEICDIYGGVHPDDIAILQWASPAKLENTIVHHKALCSQQ